MAHCVVECFQYMLHSQSAAGRPPVDMMLSMRQLQAVQPAAGMHNESATGRPVQVLAATSAAAV